jgi:hypothetical protein
MRPIVRVLAVSVQYMLGTIASLLYMLATLAAVVAMVAAPFAPAVLLNTYVWPSPGVWQVLVMTGVTMCCIIAVLPLLGRFVRRVEGRE